MLVMRNGVVKNEKLMLSGSADLELKKLRSETRDLKKFLRSIAEAVAHSLAALDVEMEKKESAERGKRLAAISNYLEYANDSLMHFGLEMDFRAINKIKKRFPRPGNKRKDGEVKTP